MHSHFAHLFLNAIKVNPVTSFVIEDEEILLPFTECVKLVLGESTEIVIISPEQDNADIETLMKSRYKKSGEIPLVVIGPRLFVFQTFYTDAYYKVDSFDPGEVGRDRTLVEISAMAVSKDAGKPRTLESLVFDPVL